MGSSRVWAYAQCVLRSTSDFGSVRLLHSSSISDLLPEVTPVLGYSWWRKKGKGENKEKHSVLGRDHGVTCHFSFITERVPSINIDHRRFSRCSQDEKILTFKSDSGSLSLSHLVQNKSRVVYIYLYVYVWVCVVHVCVFVGVHVMIQGWCQVSSLTVLLYLMHWSKISCWIWTLLLWLGRLISLFWNPPPLPPSCWNYRWLQYPPGFYMGSGNSKIQSSLTHSLSHLPSHRRRL